MKNKCKEQVKKTRAKRKLKKIWIEFIRKYMDNINMNRGYTKIYR